MIEDPDKKDDAPLLSEEEAATVIRKADERLDTWCQQLSPDEALAWMDAHIEDLDEQYARLEQEKNDFEAIARLTREGLFPKDKSLTEAMDFIRKKEHRSLAEVEALDAFDRLKDKPLETP